MRGTSTTSAIQTLVCIALFASACSNNESADAHGSAAGGSNSTMSAIAGSPSTDSESTASSLAGSASNDAAPEMDAVASGTSSSGETQAVSVLGEAKQVMQLFVEDDPTLNLNQTAIENAENVTGRLNQTLALACPTVSVQHERGGTVVTANLDRCTLDSGMVVSGQVSAKIARREIGANGELSVTFEFTQLTLGKLVVAGTVVVTTNNLKDYPIVANLQVTPLGTLAFQGTAAWTIGKPPEVTLNGTGEYQASSPPDTSNLTSNGWNCTANSPSALYLAGLHRVYGDCHANAGSMSIKKTYSCSKTLRSQTFTQAVDAIVALTWSSATPTSDVVTAQLTTISNGQQRTAEPTPVTLPWHCD